ncbi:hypothetical protein D3C85_1783920 [compost metagenome]
MFGINMLKEQMEICGMQMEDLNHRVLRQEIFHQPLWMNLEHQHIQIVLTIN